MKTLTLILLVIVSTQISANSSTKVVPRVIYGIDDRIDVFESSDNLMKELSLSTAAQIHNANISETKKNSGIYTINQKTLAQNGICKSERFSTQPVAAECTGFLIAPNKLVTAGHCITGLSDCKKYKWVFDYANRDSIVKKFSFTKDQVFTCTSVIERAKSDSSDPDGLKIDYAVVRLDRKVPGRHPLKYRAEGKISDDAVLTVIGHSSSLPIKITSVADIRDNSNDIFFVIGSDSFNGNSGSPVIDTASGIVEGILVRGDDDYEPSETGCLKPVVRDQDGGRGEDVVRMTVIKALKTR